MLRDHCIGLQHQHFDLLHAWIAKARGNLTNRVRLHDSESGYRVFVRTISTLVFVVTFLWASSYLFVASIVQKDVFEVYDYRDLLSFWILVLCASYSLIAFCMGQFLWPIGAKPTLARILIVVFGAAVILALLSPLIRKAWIDPEFEYDMRESPATTRLTNPLHSGTPHHRDSHIRCILIHVD